MAKGDAPAPKQRKAGQTGGGGRHGQGPNRVRSADRGGNPYRGGGGSGKKPPKEGASSFVAENPKMAYALVVYFALIIASPFLLAGAAWWAIA